MEGIVIRSVNYGENHVIITLLTSHYGKIGLMVRGAKKTRSRHAGVTQLYTYGEYVFYKAHQGGMGSMNQGEILNIFRFVRNDLRMSTYAAYFVEMVDKLLQDGEASDFVFQQLKAALEALNEGKDPQIIAHLLEMKMYQFSGIAPSMESCAVCGCDMTQLKIEVGWSVSAGGVVCPACQSHTSQFVSIPTGIVHMMKIMKRTDLRQLGEVTVKLETKQWLKQINRQWFDLHSGVHLKTRPVLDQIETSYD